MPSSCKASRLPSAASSPTCERPGGDRSRGESIRRRASCARALGAPQALCGRRPSPSGSESRDGACARACWVDRSASRVDLRISSRRRKNRAWPVLKRANADSAATADATKRRAGKMNAALEAPLQGRAYAAPARASQSRLLMDPTVPSARNRDAPNRGSSAFCAAGRCGEKPSTQQRQGRPRQ